MSQQPLDDIPFFVVVPALIAVTLAFYEIGYRIGRWRERRAAGEVSGPTGMIVGSILALMAFLLAIATGMAADRFDSRRGLVLQEANAIGTTFLRAGYLPQPYSEQTETLLREYVPLRIVDDQDDLQAKIRRSVEIQGEMWTIAEQLARESGERPVIAIFIEALNETHVTALAIVCEASDSRRPLGGGVIAAQVEWRDALRVCRGVHSL